MWRNNTVCWFEFNQLCQTLGICLGSFWGLFHEELLHFAFELRGWIGCYSNEVYCEFIGKGLLILSSGFLGFSEFFDYLNKILFHMLILDSDIKNILQVLPVSNRIVFLLDFFLPSFNLDSQILAVFYSIFEVFFL